jgi:serine/threonine protein phosphatase 1
MRTFVMGDPHGGFRAIKQVLERAGFNYEIDKLICLGDVCDGWSETVESIDELRKIKNLVYMMGNHDEWTLMWMDGKFSRMDSGFFTWYSQGGKETIDSYIKHGVGISEDDYSVVFLNDKFIEHRNFLKNSLPYFIENNRLFVHAGFNWRKPMEENSLHELIWDRKFYETSFIYNTQSITFKPFDEIYIGHTPTISRSLEIPFTVSNVTHMDTGAAFTGKLSIMDIDSKEVFQSEYLIDLYPDENGRNKHKNIKIKK